jgi:hypothetical protein
VIFARPFFFAASLAAVTTASASASSCMGNLRWGGGS